MYPEAVLSEASERSKSLASEPDAPVRQAVQQAVAKPVKGTRAKQNGIGYVFDGSTWNAEKP